MNRSRISYVAALLIGFGLVQAHAAPQVLINQNLSNPCTITPTDSTVFTLNDNGDVLINGSYGSNCPSGNTGSGGNPTFSPLSPAPANLTLSTTSLGSTGGSVTPSFVVYYATSCTGKVTPGANCPAISGAWNGGTVCTGTASTYCQANTAVSVPANTQTTNCTYQFQAINCTNGSTSISSQIATLTVSGTTVTGSCDTSNLGDLANTYGYARQCTGSIASSNLNLHPSWNNLYDGLMSAAWPGSAAQMGGGLVVTVSANSFGSFKFNTGSTPAGVHFSATSSYGTLGLMSVSTVPGDFFSGSSLCYGSTLDISSKSGTTASCKLSLNTDYYVNFSSADFFPPHATDCASSACNTGWGVNGFNN
jgi:hypothetical protein